MEIYTYKANILNLSSELDYGHIKYKSIICLKDKINTRDKIKIDLDFIEACGIYKNEEVSPRTEGLEIRFNNQNQIASSVDKIYFQIDNYPWIELSLYHTGYCYENEDKNFNLWDIAAKTYIDSLEDNKEYNLPAGLSIYLCNHTIKLKV